MADGVEALRKAAAANAARRVGLRVDQPNVTVGDMQLLGAGNQSEIFALPVDTTDWHPLQDVTVGSATLGMLYFLQDVDIPGNPNRLIR
jgi:hypothetical protein